MCLSLFLFCFREVSLPEKETTRFFFFSKNDERLHGKYISPLNGIEQEMAQFSPLRNPVESYASEKEVFGKNCDPLPCRVV